MATAAIVLLAVGGVGVALFGVGGRSAAGDKSTNALPPNTAEVTRQTLADAQTEDGELGYGPTTTATNRLPGTLTHVPESGTRITRGQPMYKVDNKPVMLMYGSLPAYRALRSGDEGADVKQLEQNLSALGYTGFTVDDKFTSSTASAVRQWQEDKGLTETGVVELGRVVFATGPIRVDAVQTGAGQPVSPGQKVLTYAGTEKVVTVNLDIADQRLAKKGSKVAITLPNDKTVEGRIDDVSTIIVPASNDKEEPQTKVEVVVALTDQKTTAEYALASVDVTFTAGERKDVLTAPVAALLALREGGFGVEVVEGTKTNYVPVRTGLFANGRVEITGDGIAEGTVLGMPK